MNKDLAKSLPIIGTFEGECGDAMVTNNNGLDITRPVWEEVFKSDEYKTGIENGWFIGFLGHPKDVDCMDFEHGCIVMTEGHIDSDGKIRGKFNLIGTPVGKIVLSFINAGVKFGISVRGAGDIVNQSVTPGTFIFRGFDLVIFPAYNNAIPKFSEVAASSDRELQQKYKIVCSTLRENIKDVKSSEALEIIQSQFAPQSEEYKLIEEQESDIDSEDPMVSISKAELDLLHDKIDALTLLYTEARKQCNDQLSQSDKYNSEIKDLRVEAGTSARKLRRIERITASQNERIDKEIQKIEASSHVADAANRRLKSRLETLQRDNLTYHRRVEAATSALSDKDRTILGLRSQLRETVAQSKDSKLLASNLDVRVKGLERKVTAASKIIAEYQDAYASLYASALGVSLENVTVTASTSVSQLQSMIAGANRSEGQQVMASTELDIQEIVNDEISDDTGMVTI